MFITDPPNPVLFDGRPAIDMEMPNLVKTLTPVRRSGRVTAERR